VPSDLKQKLAMNRLKLIQCGVGGFGKVWLNEQTSRSPDFELVAIVDISPAELEDAGKIASLPTERQFTSLETALQQVKADAILTVTPPVVHVEHARLAFRHGLHVMTEKPLAATMAQAREMISLAKEAGRQLAVSQQYRYSAPIQKFRQLVREKVIGDLGHAHIDFYIPADFTGTFREKMEFPLLLDMAIHHLDLIRAITGRDIARITAQSFHPSWSWYQHDPGLKMLLELEGGMSVSYSGDWSARGRSTGWNGNWRLQGSEGSLHLEKSGTEDKIFLARSERWSKDEICEEVPVPSVPLAAQAETLHRFAEAIRTGTPAETSGEDNIRSLGAVFAAMQSVREARAVTLDEILKSS